MILALGDNKLIGGTIMNNYNKMFSEGNDMPPENPENKEDEGDQESTPEPVNKENNQPNKDIQPEPIKVVVINCNQLNVRVHPDKDSRVIQIINAGEEITMLGISKIDNAWSYVRLNDGLRGNVMREYIKEV